MALLLVMAANPDAQSQERTYQERLKLYNTVSPLGESPFGEQIGLYTGSLSFLHTDVVLEGKGPPIVIARSVDTKIKNWPSLGTLGDWDLAIPRIETLVRSHYPTGGGNPGENWQTEDYSSDPYTVGTLQRCTNFTIPYDEDMMQGSWWNGYEFINERGQRQPLLVRNSNYPGPSTMTVNGDTTPITAVTLNNWQMGCLPQTSNGQAGEAFVLVSPEGMRYFMNRLIGLPAGAYIERVCMGIAASGSRSGGRQITSTHVFAPLWQHADGTGYIPAFAGSRRSDPGNSVLAGGCTLIKYGRQFETMYVTRIEDRFGNYLTYNYQGSRLTSIEASDGRKATINWRQDLAAIESITVDNPTPRTWTYAYGEHFRLSKVTLPDNSTWEFTNLPLDHAVVAVQQSSCTWRERTPATLDTNPSIGTIKTPSNLVGTFDVRTTFFGRSYVESNCIQGSLDEPTEFEAIPPIFNIGALHSRSISGPGMPTSTWIYTYSPAIGSATHDACATTNTCAETNWVEVLEPDGSKTRYTMSTRWGSTEGKLLKMELFAAGQAAPTRTV